MSAKTTKPTRAAQINQTISLFCLGLEEICNHSKGAEVGPFALFIGNMVYGKRLYATRAGAVQAMAKLAPHFVKGKGTGPARRAAFQKAGRDLKKSSSLRKDALFAAIERELLSVQQVQHRPA